MFYSFQQVLQLIRATFFDAPEVYEAPRDQSSGNGINRNYHNMQASIGESHTISSNGQSMNSRESFGHMSVKSFGVEELIYVIGVFLVVQFIAACIGTWIWNRSIVYLFLNIVAVVDSPLWIFGLAIFCKLITC